MDFTNTVSERVVSPRRLTTLEEMKLSWTCRGEMTQIASGSSVNLEMTGTFHIAFSNGLISVRETLRIVSDGTPATSVLTHNVQEVGTFCRF